VTGPRDIDAAIDRLDEALRTAGLAGPETPSDMTPLAEVTAAAEPYVLPSDLRRFWERVDPESIAVLTFPRLGGPADALELHRMLRDVDAPVPIGLPPVLLPVDYASHCYGVIELESEWTEGGTILEWDFDAAPLVSRSVADRIDLLAELVSEGCFEREGDLLVIDHGVEQEKRRVRLDASGPHPVFGDRHAIPMELESWPAHWLVASGIDLRDRTPLGATHTIAELVAAAGEGQATGRIHGEVIRLVGSAAGALVVVDDGTRTLDVWCPAGTSPWGPVHRTRFELEVTIDGSVGELPELDSTHEEITRHALGGDLASAQEATVAFIDVLDQHRPSAVAADLRPLD
jgi:hypothetical protein